MHFTLTGTQYKVYQALSLKLGDHIGVRMTDFIPQYNGDIHHHGIVSHIADDNTIKIIHKVPKDSKNICTPTPIPATIEEVDLEFFFNGAQNFTIFEHENYTKDKREQAIEQARSHINNIDSENYHLVFDNCDSFILSCITGRYVLNLPIKYNLTNDINTTVCTRVFKHLTLY